MTATRNLVFIFGDQLDLEGSHLRGFDRRIDRVCMAEVEEEATLVWSHKIRLAFFFSAMRHFREALEKRGVPVDYQELGFKRSAGEHSSFPKFFEAKIREQQPERVIITLPGDYRVLEAVRTAAIDHRIELEIRSDDHFYSTPEEFAAWAKGKQNLVMEFYYRFLRKKHGILIDEDGGPVGGAWNFDSHNRETFGKKGPPKIPPAPRFTIDRITREVFELVESRFSDHPGSLEKFNLPVARKEALALLDHFVENLLEGFGPYQDAMWSGEPFLFHSRLSAPLNVKLLNPREVIDAVIGRALETDFPLGSLEGFVRQILGWREFVRGVYWLETPEYAELNALGARRDLPSFYWNGETDMECLRQAMRNLLDHGYTHHIERLMVLGLFALLDGADPYKFHQWHMAMYTDAVDWVSLPNTLGMSQYGDGGIVGTKPYCASANYINKMSNHCSACPYDPKKTVGERACPFNALYWDFLARNAAHFAGNPRMAFQMRNLERKKRSELEAIRAQADRIREGLRRGPHPPAR